MNKTEGVVTVFGMITAAVFLGFIFSQISACDIQGRKIELEKRKLLYENWGRATPTEAEIRSLEKELQVVPPQ